MDKIQITKMTEEMEAFLFGCCALMRVKNPDYHPEGIPMLEVFRAAAEANITPQQVLWGHLRKQLSAVRSYVIDRQLASEPITSRLKDVVNYAALFEFLETNWRELLRNAYNYTTVNLHCDGPKCQFRTNNVAKCDNCILIDWLRREYSRANEMPR